MSQSEFIRDRLDFLQIDEDTVEQLQQARRILEPALDEMLERFYDHILEEPNIRRLLADDATIERARSAQKEHWLSTLFDGILDSDYFDKAHKIGIAHARIGLTPSWYIGGYCQMLGQFTDIVLKDQTVGRKPLAAMIQAIQRAIFLDMDLVIHSYLDSKDETMRDLLHRATGFSSDVSALSNEIGTTARKMCDVADELSGNGHDLSEQREQLAEQARQLMEQSTALSERLAEIATGDRLYIADDGSEIGTIARIKALFHIGNT
jgi:hypothetical protein